MGASRLPLPARSSLLRPPAVILAVLALGLTGCGGDEEPADEAGSTQAAPATTPAPTATAEPDEPAGTGTAGDDASAEEGGEGGGGPASAAEEAAIRETLVTWLTEGGCDLMTDAFLEEQAFAGDNRRERCKAFTDTFQKPQYGADDIKTFDYMVDGDEATAVVGDDISNVETTFRLKREGGTWRIDGTELG